MLARRLPRQSKRRLIVQGIAVAHLQGVDGEGEQLLYRCLRGRARCWAWECWSSRRMNDQVDDGPLDHDRLEAELRFSGIVRRGRPRDRRGRRIVGGLVPDGGRGFA